MHGWTGQRRRTEDDLATVIEPLVPGLRRLARGLAPEGVQGDDLVQDCLERAIARWDQRRPDGSPKAWLYAIMVNLARDEARSGRRRRPHVEIDAVPAGDLATPPGQEAALVVRDVLEAIRSLPDDQRDLLLLVSVEGLSYLEAADVLDLPIGTVMSRLSRARERLRRMMDGTEGEKPRLRRVK